MDDLFRATLAANAAVRSAPHEPWGYAAQCDIAKRWGDVEMIDRCIEKLRRVAPQHDETRRAIAARAGGLSRGMVLGWCTLGLIGLLTVGQAARRVGRRLTRRASRSPALLPVLLIAALLDAASPRATWATGPGEPAPRITFTIDDADPEAGVPAAEERDARPLEVAHYVQELVERANAAAGRGEHAAASRYHRALAKVVPDRATAFARLCKSLEASGQREQALEACRSALARPGAVVDDHIRFVRLLSARSGDLTAKEVEDGKEVAGHLLARDETRVAGHHLQCELGARIRNVELLQTCTAALAALAPADPKTIAFQWSLALHRGDADEARRHIERARAAGVKADGILRMEEATSALGAAWRRSLGDWRLLAPVLLGAAAALLVARLRRRLGVESL